MNIVTLSLLLFLAAVTGSAQPAATSPRGSVPATEVFAVEFKKLQAEMAEARRVAMLPHGAAKTQKEHYDLQEKTSANYRAAAAPLLARGVELARSQQMGSNSLSVLIWLLSEQPDVPSAEAAADLLIKRHLEAPETFKVADKNAWLASPWPQRVLLAVTESKHVSEDIRARALFGAASGLQSQRDYKESAELEAEAANLFRKLAATYPNLKYRGKTWADIVESHLLELEHLTLGKTAPEIEGEDIDGVKFKLSDYRGRVVLLDFWGDWCGPCREIYREGPALLKQHTGKPFAIVAVNSDEDRAKLKRRVKEAGVTWRFFWDGGMIGGPIARAWNVEGWPMLYVIDHRGIIRAKYLRGSALEQVIEQCVRAAEARH